MANTKTFDRKPVFQRLTLAAGTEQVISERKSVGANLTVFPALGSNFPELSFAVTPTKGASWPISNAVVDGWRGWIEHGGQTFAVVALYLTQVELFPGNDSPAVVVAFDASGKEVARLECHQSDPPFMFAAIRLKLAFNKSGETMGSGNFKTTCSELDPIEFTQTWSAVVNPPKGLEPYRIGGDAKDLRRAGIDPLKYNHFRGGRLFTFRPGPGREYASAMVEVAEGKALAITWDVMTGKMEQAAPISVPDMAFLAFANFDLIF